MKNKAGEIVMFCVKFSSADGTWFTPCDTREEALQLQKDAPEIHNAKAMVYVYGIGWSAIGSVAE